MPDPKVTKTIYALQEIDTPPGAYTEEIGAALVHFLNIQYRLLNVQFRFTEKSELVVDVDPNVYDEVQDHLFKHAVAAFRAGYNDGHFAVQPQWCPECGQIMDMKSPVGCYTLGHVPTCNIAIGEIGCTCGHDKWPICDHCGQARPPKVERCTCNRITTKKMQCMHEPGNCQNIILETDYPRVCQGCQHKMEQLYHEAVS